MRRKFSSNCELLSITRRSTLLNGTDRTLVVTGDSGLVLYETCAKREISLPGYIAGAYRTGTSSSPADVQLLERDFATPRYTSVADLSLALRVKPARRAGIGPSGFMMAIDAG